MNVMIVEGEMLLAMELESEVEAAGHTIIGMAASSDQAPDIVQGSALEFAFVDIHLQNGPTGVDVGRLLAQERIPYIFVSGNIKKLPRDLAGALGVIEKPYTMNGMANALAYIDAVIKGEEGRLPPASLVFAEDMVRSARRESRHDHPLK